MLRPASKPFVMSDLHQGDRTSLGTMVAQVLVLVSASFMIALLAYPSTHLEWQGVDIAHHALMIDQYTDPSGTLKPLAFLEGYPRFSHLVTSCLLPLFSGDPVWTMRAMALACIALTYLMQWKLLASFSDARTGLLGVAVVQSICVLCKVGAASHFFPDGLYNFSRAVGGVGLWTAILLSIIHTQITWKAILYRSLTIASASFALACHSAPGAIAFLGIGLSLSIQAVVRRSRVDGVMLIVAIIAGTYLVFGSEVSRMMASHADLDGWMPVAHWPILLAAVPTGIWAIVHMIRSRKRLASVPLVELTLVSSLLASLSLLAYAAFGLVRGKVAPYAVKSLFFYTTPLALLLGATWLYPWWQKAIRSLKSSLPVAQSKPIQVCLWIVAIGLTIWPLARDRSLSSLVREADPFSKTVSKAKFVCPPDRSADGARRLLLSRKERYKDALYFDLGCPTTAYFASQSALGRGIHPEAIRYSDHPKQVFLDALRASSVRALLLPSGQDPGVLGVDLQATPDPPLTRWERIDSSTPIAHRLESP